MRLLQSVVSMLAVVAVSACAASGGGKSDSASAAADVQAIGKVRDAYAAAFKAGDVAGLTAMYTTDGLTQPNNQPTATGASGISASYTGFFGQYNIVAFTLTGVKTEASGNLGYDIGTYTFVATPKPKGDTIKADGRYVVLLRKGADGTWKAIADMDNLPTAPPMAPPPPAAKGKAK